MANLFSELVPYRIKTQNSPCLSTIQCSFLIKNFVWCFYFISFFFFFLSALLNLFWSRPSTSWWMTKSLGAGGTIICEVYCPQFKVLAGGDAVSSGSEKEERQHFQ